MIRALGEMVNNQVKGARDRLSAWSPSAYGSENPTNGYSGGPPNIGGTNNGGLTNPNAPSHAGAGEYGSGAIGGHAATWAPGESATQAGSAQGAAMGDPLFFSPASQFATSGGAPQQQNLPNAYRYPGSEGWVSSTGQHVQRG